MSQEQNPHPYFINQICCTGCAACAEMEPELFAMDENEKGITLRETGPEDAIRKVMAFCPGDCIEIEE